MTTEFLAPEALRAKFNALPDRIQAKINGLATTYTKEPLQIYSWWCEYCEDCVDYSQSPVFPEFEIWYKVLLESGEE